MKKFALAGMSIFLALLFVTCELGPVLEDEGPARTNVRYSKDGTEVTIYLDGTTFPVTESQRAINKELAMMSYDYLEAVFVYGTSGNVARSAWELGQAAGISGVYRTDAGIDYSAFVAPTSTTGAASIIFVGRKADKTLLGVGSLYKVDDKLDTDTVAAGTQLQITTGTRSVTFLVDALQTNIAPTGTPTAALTADSSFLTNAGITNPGAGTATAPTTAPAFGITRYVMSSLGGMDYPIFVLPNPKAKVVENGSGAEYVGNIFARFFISGKTLGTAHRLANGIMQYANIIYTKREPRYLEGGRYTYLKSNIDTITTFSIYSHGGDAVQGAAITPTALVSTINIRFTTTANSTGIFSILFRIPVLAMTDADSTNGQPNAEHWSIRPGYGSNLYNIDDGKGLGGCVLLSIGNTALDWIEILLDESGDIYFM